MEELASNAQTNKGTRFTDALEFAEEVIPVADAKIAELSKAATTLPGRPSAGLDSDDDGGSTAFHAPLLKDVHASIRNYEGEDGLIDNITLKIKYRQRELDPQFAGYRASRIEELRGNEKPYFCEARGYGEFP